MSSPRRLRLTRRAERDLRGILRYSFETWGREQRDAYEAHLMRAMHDLATFPEMGRPRDELGRGIRSHRVEQHVVFYRVVGDLVRVVRLLHVRMEPVGRL